MREKKRWCMRCRTRHLTTTPHDAKPHEEEPMPSKKKEITVRHRVHERNLEEVITARVVRRTEKFLFWALAEDEDALRCGQHKGTVVVADLGKTWVRGWEGPEVEALRAGVVADNDAKVKKMQDDAQSERKRQQDEAAARVRREHEEIVTALRIAARLVADAEMPNGAGESGVPRDLRRVAFRFALSAMSRPEAAHLGHFYSHLLSRR